MITRLGAAAVAAGLAGFVLAPLAALSLRAEGFTPTPADWAAVRFTLLQAALSAAVSTLLAIPVARALARRRFVGRRALITLMGAPFLLPVIVATLGLIAVFGRSGLLNGGLSLIGLPPLSIYGLHGVVLAHVFLNLPLATRMILQGWQAIPAERFRLGQSLGFAPRDSFRHLEAPMLREVLPGAALIIFTLCLTSFAVALTLGGGPRATTVELAIYQALRFDYDLGRAATLAGLQFLLCAIAASAAWGLARPAAFGAGQDRATLPAAPGGWRKGMDAAVILAAALFLILPLGAVVLRGLPGLADLPASLWPATLRSLLVALVSATLSTAAALTLALAVAARPNRLFDAVAMLPLATSGLVLGTGLFLLAQPLVPPARLALPVTILVNTALSLPFLYRLLLPEARALHQGYDRLASSLSLHGLARLRWLTLPRLARPLGFGAGIAAALSMGDLGVIALFATDQGATLPLVVHRLMGAYRMEAAAAAALILVTLSFALFWACDQGGRHADPA
ncbi:MAG: thiamine/thiamine pyrophosphate ABC transporter permease ThiP [Pseudomonadota bacterium]